MTKLKVINRAACNLLCETIEENLAEIATKLGVRIRVGSGSFDSGQVTFKIECALIANGEVQSKEATDFKTYASRYGLKAEDLGREFTDFSGKRFKIVGCKPRSHIYPIICQQVTGRNGHRVKFPSQSVKVCLGKTK